MTSCWALIATLAFGAGCSQIFGLDSPEHTTGGDDAGTPDGTDSGLIVDAALCYGTYETVCLESEPPASLTLATAIDTDSDTCANATPTNVCVIAARDVTINATVRVTGSRPLVIVGADALTIDSAGVLDGGSTRVGPSRGPGAGVTGVVCSAGTDPIAPGTAGGAGGTLGGSGGGGGAGTSTGGVAGGLPAVTGLRAGCPGQKGTGANNGAVAGLGGDGGGAIYLISASMTVKGHITVGGAGGGAGGFGAAGASGGGGGGSGGMLVLETNSLYVTSGALLANGGGGGEGSSTVAGGMFGQDAQDTVAAPGGTALPNGGDGGEGSFGQQLAGSLAGTATSGGGGGGGAGIIKIITPVFSNSNGTVSPPKS